MPVLLNESNITTESAEPSINWKDSPSAQRILDAICQIIAAEYSVTAKEHPELFLAKE